MFQNKRSFCWLFNIQINNDLNNKYVGWFHWSHLLIFNVLELVTLCSPIPVVAWLTSVITDKRCCNYGATVEYSYIQHDVDIRYSRGVYETHLVICKFAFSLSSHIYSKSDATMFSNWCGLNYRKCDVNQRIVILIYFLWLKPKICRYVQNSELFNILIAWNFITALFGRYRNHQHRNTDSLLMRRLYMQDKI